MENKEYNVLRLSLKTESEAMHAHLARKNLLASRLCWLTTQVCELIMRRYMHCLDQSHFNSPPSQNDKSSSMCLLLSRHTRFIVISNVGPIIAS